MKKLLLITIVLLSGCASMGGIAVQSEKIGGEPGDTNIHKISAGEVLYSEYKYTVSSVAKIDNKEYKVTFAQSFRSDQPLVLNKMTTGEEAYCGKTFVVVPLAEWQSIYICFFDTNSDGYFDETLWSGSRVSMNDKVPYTKVNQMTTGVDGFKREIIFQGRTEKTVKFKYREFMNNLARPAFTQDIEYFLTSEGATSGNFKGVKIDITSVVGNYIEYKVSGHIDRQ